MPQARTEVAVEFSECCAAEVALQHLLFCSAEAFLPLSYGFQAPTFRPPRLGPAENDSSLGNRQQL